MYYVVKYTGIFAFIKPVTALRDVDIVSQKHLNPSTIAGIERKLFPELLNVSYTQDRILRHRISYSFISKQLETIRTQNFNKKKKGGAYHFRKDTGRIIRGVLVNPVLHLAFSKLEYAEKAVKETVCLCRNEDLMFPESIEQMRPIDFDKINGTEMLFDSDINLVTAGFNRYNRRREKGEIKIFGNPINEESVCF